MRKPFRTVRRVPDKVRPTVGLMPDLDVRQLHLGERCIAFPQRLFRAPESRETLPRLICDNGICKLAFAESILVEIVRP